MFLIEHFLSKEFTSKLKVFLFKYRSRLNYKRQQNLTKATQNSS